MSTISSAYNALLSTLGSLYSTHYRLANPYKLDGNADVFLAKGYGIAMGAGENTQRLISGGYLSIRRTFDVTLTRLFSALDEDGSSKATTEKQLFEDQLALINYFEEDPTMGQTVTNVKFVSDNGIETVFGEREQYLAVTSSFSVEYLEPIT
jgi:hypothetical protein